MCYILRFFNFKHVIMSFSLIFYKTFFFSKISNLIPQPFLDVPLEAIVGEVRGRAVHETAENVALPHVEVVLQALKFSFFSKNFILMKGGFPYFFE